MAIDFDTVREQSCGRWLSIFRALGIDVREDGKHSPCPSCKGKDRFRVDSNVAERGSYYCSQCDPGDGFSLVMKVLCVDIKEAMEAVAGVVGVCEKTSVPKESKMTPEIMRSIFNGSNPATFDDVAGGYLKNRGLSVMPEDVQYMDKCWEPETKKNQHALLALVRLPDGRATTMHRIFLSSESNKLNIESPKKMLPTLFGTNGAAIRLFTATDTVGICEGIETAIAVREDMNIPTWACISTSIMETFEPPPNIKKVIIFADNDKNFAGQKSAYVLANRLIIKYKLSVDVFVPEVPGDDFLDQFLRQKVKK